MPTTPKLAMGTALAANTAVTAIVGNQIYPDQAKQGVDEPYLVFQQMYEDQKIGFGGPCGSIKAGFQLTGLCATRVQALALTLALFAQFRGTSGNFGGLQVAFSRIGGDNNDEGPEDSDQIPRPGEDSGLREVRIDVKWVIPPGQY
jgi:hypothetical protein